MSDLTTDSAGCQASYTDPIPGIIPYRSVTLFSGATGAGKTTMIVELIVRLMQGRTVCGRATNKPTALYYIAADRSWDSDYRPWFEKLGYPEVPHYAIADDDTITDVMWSADRALGFLDYCLAQLSPIPGSLVVVDPMAPLFIAGDPNMQRPVVRSVIGFAHRCRSRSITILAAGWQGKQKNDDRERYHRAIDRMAGSTAFAGCCHTQMYIEEPNPPKVPYHLFGWRPRHAPEADFKFVRDPSSGLFIPFSRSGTEEKRSVLLLSLFRQDGLPTTRADLMEHASEIPMSEATLDRALEDLLDRGLIERIGRGVYRRNTIN